MPIRCCCAMVVIVALVGCAKRHVPSPEAADTPAAPETNVSDETTRAEGAEHLRSLYVEAEQELAADPQNPDKLYRFAQVALERGEALTSIDRKTSNECFRQSAKAMREYAKVHPQLGDNDSQLLAATIVGEARAFASDNQPQKALASLREAVQSRLLSPTALESADEFAKLRDRPEFKQVITEARAALQKHFRAEARQEIAAQQPFPFQFSLPNLQGKTISSADYQGKLLIVDLWGTWCPPCRMEVPHFIELYTKYRASGVEMVGINFERVPREEWVSTITTTVQELGINYPCLLSDEATSAKVPNLEGFPTTLFLDRTGTVRLRIDGYHPYEKLEGIVLELLDEGANKNETR
jgi:thiol-disulfide isomerase/thioredoxin